MAEKDNTWLWILGLAGLYFLTKEKKVEVLPVSQPPTQPQQSTQATQGITPRIGEQIELLLTELAKAERDGNGDRIKDLEQEIDRLLRLQSIPPRQSFEGRMRKEALISTAPKVTKESVQMQQEFADVKEMDYKRRVEMLKKELRIAVEDNRSEDIRVLEEELAYWLSKGSIGRFR